MRALLIVLDSVGVGSAPDADRYGDAGADTLGHLLAYDSGLKLPALWSLGWGMFWVETPAMAPARPGAACASGRRGRTARPDTGNWRG